MEEIEIKCPAKVNLFLEVLGKRADGFHEIETVMAPIELYDNIIFRKKASGIKVFCDSPSVPSGEQNIVFTAARRLFEKFGLEGGIEADIKKGIPAGSGLGGGSSDAAGVFAAVNALFDLGSGWEDFYPIGREIGADVPFFLGLLDEKTTAFSGGAFVGRGRGDEMTFAGEFSGIWLVVAYPGFSVSTPDVYGSLGLTAEKRDIKMMLERIRKKDAAGVAARLFNRLEDCAMSTQPRIKEVKEYLLRAGSAGALMTGSGSAVFGFASDEKSAWGIREKILANGRGIDAYVIRTL